MEIVDVYNNRHEQLNYTKGRKELSEGEYRLSTFIWIINNKNEILLQQRLKTAKKMPNMWGTTAGGVIAGETSLEAAVREVKEELGLKIGADELEFIGSNKRINDYVEVWLCKKDVDISKVEFNPDEVQDVKWFNIDEFKEYIQKGYGINSGFDIFSMYFENFYNKHYELIEGKIVTVNNEK